MATFSIGAAPNLGSGLIIPKLERVCKVTEEDAETRRHGDAESSRETCDASHETPKGVNVQGFEASSHSLNGTPGIGRGLNPRPISVPVSPPPRVPASLKNFLQGRSILFENPNGNGRQFMAETCSSLLCLLLPFGG